MDVVCICTHQQWYNLHRTNRHEKITSMYTVHYKLMCTFGKKIKQKIRHLIYSQQTQPKKRVYSVPGTHKTGTHKTGTHKTV